MKRSEINLAGTFPEVLATLLTLPGTATKAEGIRTGRAADSVVSENGNCDAEVKEAFRSLYEAANGRQVETQVGFIAIAPPVAGFLKDKPYYVVTQYEFFLEAFARIVAAELPTRRDRTNGARTRGGKLVTSAREAMETTSTKKHTIVMTAADHKELTDAIAAAGKLSERGRSETNALEVEIARAEIVHADDLPPDVITMNSRAELLDLETGERMEFTLVFPIDADIEAGKISVLSPLGTAMLGYRAGDEFEWPVPYGLRRLEVTHVHFQPEAVLKKAA